MTWQVPLRPKILAGAHKADSKDLFPKPVDDDSRRQRIVGIHQPPGQGQPVRGLVCRQRMKNSWNPLRYLFAQSKEVAPQLDVCLASLFPLKFAHDGDRIWLNLLDFPGQFVVPELVRL